MAAAHPGLLYQRAPPPPPGHRDGDGHSDHLLDAGRISSGDGRTLCQHVAPRRVLSYRGQGSHQKYGRMKWPEEGGGEVVGGVQ